MRHSRAVLIGATFLVSLAPAPVHASGVPSPANSTTPACFNVVASNGSAPASAFGQFEVVYRDLANNPIPYASVVVDLSAIPELALATDPLDLDAILDCGAKTVRKLTDTNGRAVFCIVGGGRPSVPATSLPGGGRIYMNGILTGAPTVGVFDLDGERGLGASDLVQFLGDFVSGENYGRSDFNCSGAIGAGDLVIWLTAFASGTQIVSAATSCP